MIIRTDMNMKIDKILNPNRKPKVTKICEKNNYKLKLQKGSGIYNFKYTLLLKGPDDTTLENNGYDWTYRAYIGYYFYKFRYRFKNVDRLADAL